MSAALDLTAVSDLPLSPPDEARIVHDTAARYLAAQSPTGNARTPMAAPELRRQWRHLAQETGLPGLLIPEAFGGTDLPFGVLVGAMEEMGARVYGGPYLSTAVAAASALLLCDDEGLQGEELPAIATGERIVGLPAGDLFLSERAGGSLPHVRRGDRLSGTWTPVLDGAAADRLLLPAREDDGIGLFLVDCDQPGVHCDPLALFDPSRGLARLVLDDVPVRPVGPRAEAGPILRQAADRIVTALAAEQLGGVRACLDMAVHHARERHQFGRAIGSFQAVKHRCADLLLDLEASRSAVAYAAACADEVHDELPVAASMAKSQVGESYGRAAAANLQIHGGLGFTWEHDCHLHLKRAKAGAALFGSPLFHRRRLLRLLSL